MDRSLTIELDLLLRRLSEVTRLLPALTPTNAAQERLRLSRCVARREPMEPAWRPPAFRPPPRAWQWLVTARARAADAPGRALYERRLDEIELDLEMLSVLGEPERVRPLAARRFGTGADPVETERGPVPVSDVARALLATVSDAPEPRVLPADAAPDGGPSAASLIRAVVRAAGLEARVAVEPRLAAAAAAGDRTVLLAARRFGWREVRRLAVHEVLGHLVSAANGRAQPLRIVELGTAGSFADQEGLAILLEERAGLLCGGRLRTLAARVVAADFVQAGARFDETARSLVDELGFAPDDAVSIAERAFRGGGVARDVGYLAGWMRVRRAVTSGAASLDELRMGRVSVAELGELRRLVADGLVRPPVYRPSLSCSLAATQVGTRLYTSPPSDAASLTRFEAT